MLISLPEEVQKIIKLLNDNAFDGYLVGGCVRDSILGKVPKDWDITTNAKPDEVKKMFDKTIDTGLKHGTVTVVLNSQNFEITTYRIDGQYSDNRRPDTIEFTSSLKDDLSRRDFCMNSIAYHHETGFFDPFCGVEDIEKHFIRTVGKPDERFNEDALRMLRAVRFSSQLGFDVDEAIIQSMRINNNLINNISQERIREELTKILISGNPEKFQILLKTGLLRHIIPEFEACFDTDQNNPYHVYNVAQHTLKAVAQIDEEPVLRWTMLLHDIGKPLTKTIDEEGIGHFYGHPVQSEQFAENILKRLKFDNNSIAKICRLVRYHDRLIEPNIKAVRKAIFSIGEDIFPDLLKVKEADVRAQNPQFIDERIEIIESIRSIYNEIVSEQQCMSLKDLAINGGDLIKLGFAPGKQIGIILNRLLYEVLENPEINTRDELVQLVLHLTVERPPY